MGTDQSGDLRNSHEQPGFGVRSSAHRRSSVLRNPLIPDQLKMLITKQHNKLTFAQHD